MRIFIAIPLSKELKENLAKVQSQLKALDARITWVDPENFHLTLEFLGEVEEQKAAEISAAIEKACQQVKPFELRLEGLKLIPNVHRPRVIAVSVSGDLETFWQLKNKIRQELQSLGFRFEEEKSSHITLGRIKGNLNAQTKNYLRQLFETSHLYDLNHVKVSKIVLMQSTLTQTGPIYTLIAEIPLTRSHYTTLKVV